MECPYTAQEYLESLRDGREVWLYGERVKDVTTHPAFRNAARVIAHLYDLMWQDAGKREWTRPPDGEGNGFTHPFFIAPRSAADLYASREGILRWARATYGWMGRTPDYKASFLATLGPQAEWFAPFSDNALRWYREAQMRVHFWNHAIVNPPVDRHRPPHEVDDVYVHVVRETDGGIIVSGAKVVATGSVLTHHNFIAHNFAAPINDPRFALVFTVPVNAPGVKFLCRPSYEFVAEQCGSPFDNPLSTRFDENDAILILDNVFIPWENIFVYGDVEKVNRWDPYGAFAARFMFHGCVRLCVKLDFVVGLLIRSLQLTGAQEFRGVQVRIGEALAWRHLFWMLSEVMCSRPSPWVEGYVIPNVEACLTYRVFAPIAWSRIREIALQDVASGLIYLPSHVKDLTNDETRAYIDRFIRGSDGTPALERVKIMKLLYDAVISEFAGRHELYEMNYAGSFESCRLGVWQSARERGLVDQLLEFVDACLGEYDERGWRVDYLAQDTDKLSVASQTEDGEEALEVT